MAEFIQMLFRSEMTSTLSNAKGLQVDGNLFASALIKPDSNPGNILELIKQKFSLQKRQSNTSVNIMSVTSLNPSSFRISAVELLPGPGLHPSIFIITH